METLIASTGVTLAVITFAIALAAIKRRPEPAVEPAVVVPEPVVLSDSLFHSWQSTVIVVFLLNANFREQSALAKRG